jgi:ribosome maturation factor RimP
MDGLLIGQSIFLPGFAVRKRRHLGSASRQRVGSTRFFCALLDLLTLCKELPRCFSLPAMTHPLIPPILELAASVATELSLEVVNAAVFTHHRPPSLRVDVRNLNGDTSLEDCERMSRALDEALDRTDLIPFAYTLEVSSPGAATTLTTDREFEVFRGFTVSVQLLNPLKGKTELKGQLKDRDDTTIYLTQKGRVINIPRVLAAAVVLDSD